MIEDAVMDDAKEILQLQKLAYRSEAAIYDDYTIPPLVQSLEGMLTDLRKQIVLKIMIDGKIIGSVRGHVQDGTGYIGRLIVHPEFQNRGTGTQLIKAIEERLAEAKRYELFTGHKSERNLYLYKKLGYNQFRSEKINDRLTQVYLEKVVIS
jgi:ribosomal protein S18 acetylase RimI-like enzyme